jgi:hypothetical protein
MTSGTIPAGPATDANQRARADTVGLDSPGLRVGVVTGWWVSVSLTDPASVRSSLRLAPFVPG